MSDPKYKHIGRPSIRVIEECSELIKAVCKAERFGYLNNHPDTPNINNIDEIRSEMHDVVESFERLDETMRHIGFTIENLINETEKRRIKDTQSND